MKFKPLDTRTRGAVAARRQSSRPPGHRVLLLDDSRTMLDVLRVHLSGTGLQLVSSVSPQVALSNAVSSPPDLVITDLNMAGMDGLEFCRRLRGAHATSRVPVIMVSSKLTDEVRSRAASLGVQACLSKPVDPDRLRAEVTRALSQTAV